MNGEPFQPNYAPFVVAGIILIFAFVQIFIHRKKWMQKFKSNPKRSIALISVGVVAAMITASVVLGFIIATPH